MNKTDDEIKAAVLAECERLSKLKDYEVDLSVLPLELSVADQGDTYQVYTKHMNVFIPKNGKIHHQTTMLVYRLLGLEAKAEKERVAKLVEALEKISNDGFEDDSEYHMGYLDAYCDLKVIAENALIEWKGGQNGRDI